MSVRTKLPVIIIFCLAGFFTALAHPGIGIVMDSKGNVFYTDLKQVWKISPDGTVYLTDLYDLVRVTPDGKVGTIARGLASWNVKRLVEPDRNAVMGLWTDRQGDLYAAVYADRVVKKIQQDGRVTSVVHSGPPWAPTGGMIAPNGDLWILECSVTNAVRVRRISPSGQAMDFH